MKVVVGILLVLMAIDPIKIGKINSAKSDARKAFVGGDYKLAVQRYKYLTDSLGVTEDEVRLNLANAYFLAKDTANVVAAYQGLTGSGIPHIRSKAQQQLGVLNNQAGKSAEALNNFKQAIKADPNNSDARYNYEMLKKKLDNKKKEDEKNNKDKNAPDKPSEYAKKLKEQADKLSAAFRFREALDLMNDGAKKDPSVQFYSDFIKRLDTVVKINRK